MIKILDNLGCIIVSYSCFVVLGLWFFNNFVIYLCEEIVKFSFRDWPCALASSIIAESFLMDLICRCSLVNSFVIYSRSTFAWLYVWDFFNSMVIDKWLYSVLYQMISLCTVLVLSHNFLLHLKLKKNFASYRNLIFLDWLYFFLFLGENAIKHM